MPAIHKLKFMDAVLTFQDSDIIDALAEQDIVPSDRLSHDLFIQGARYAAAVYSADVGRYGEGLDEAILDDANLEEVTKGFEFAPTSLVQEVYGL